jgi:hypothetical protein
MLHCTIYYVDLNVFFVPVGLGISVLRIYAACIMTSLEMAGIQVSALKISVAHKAEWLNYLDAETKACAWPGSSMSIPPAKSLLDIPSPPESIPEKHEVRIVYGH